MRPIDTAYQSGKTLYAIIHNPDGTVWNEVGQAFEAFNVSNWADYAIALTEQGISGYYRADYPAAITDVLTTEVLYSQVGIVPAISDAPPIGLGSSQGTNSAAVGNSVNAALNLQTALDAEVQGEAILGTLSTTQMSTDLASTLDNVYVGRIIVFIDGANAGAAANILSYNGTSKLLTFTNVPLAPVVGDKFIIL